MDKGQKFLCQRFCSHQEAMNFLNKNYDIKEILNFFFANIYF